MFTETYADKIEVRKDYPRTDGGPYSKERMEAMAQLKAGDPVVRAVGGRYAGSDFKVQVMLIDSVWQNGVIIVKGWQYNPDGTTRGKTNGAMIRPLRVDETMESIDYHNFRVDQRRAAERAMAENKQADEEQAAASRVTEIMQDAEMPFGKQVTFTMTNKRGSAVTCTFFAAKKKVWDLTTHEEVDGFEICRPSYISVEGNGRIHTSTASSMDVSATETTRDMVNRVAFAIDSWA